MRVSRVNFKPSLLSCAIAAAASGLAQQALAVDLCVGQTTITLTGAAADATCTVDQAGATVTVPSGSTFAQEVWLQAPDAAVTNLGTLGEQLSFAETGEELDIEVEANGLISSLSAPDLQGAIVNRGTLRAGLAGTVHATGAAYTSTSTYTSGGSTYTSTYTYGADAHFWGAARAVDLNGLGAAQISNTGTIQAVVDIAVTADDGFATGFGLAQAVHFDNGLAGPLTNTGTLSATANIEADAGQAIAIALQVEGAAGGDIDNSGKILASAGSHSDGVATLAVAASFGGLEGADFTNSGIIEATATGIGGGGPVRRGRSGGTQAAGVLIGIDVGSSSARLMGSGSAEYAGLYAGATFSNSGRITARLGDEATQGDALGVGIGVLVSGTGFSNEEGGLIEARAGSKVYDAEVTGLVIESVWGDATASNAGVIAAQVEDSAGGAYASGVDIGDLYQFADFDNSGDILGSATASHYASARGLSVDYLDGFAGNTGTIAALAQARDNFADATGVVLDQLAYGGRFVNEGDVIARAGVQSSGYARATALRVWDLDGEISNSGTISASVFTPDLPERSDDDMGPRALGGGGGGEEIALYVQGGSGVINNEVGGVIDGAIRIDSYSSVPFLVGPMLAGPGGVTLNNSGRIVLSGTTNSFIYGSYNQLETGTLELELRWPGIEPAASFYATQADFSASNRIVVSVDPLAQIADGDTFTDVIYADNLIKPDGFDVTDTSLFWDFDTAETANSLSLVARYLGVGEVLGDAREGLTPEQLALASDLLLGYGGPDFAPIVDALNRAPDGNAAREVIQSVGPRLSGAQGFSARGATQGAINAINARLNELRGGNSGDVFQKNAVWIKPYLGMAEQDDVDGIDGYDVNTAGFILGMDGDLSDSWRVGFGVASSATEVEGEQSDLDVDSIQVALYASYALNETAAIDLDINHITNSFDGSRRIPAASATARSSYDGHQFAAGVAVSNRVALGEKATFVPSAQVRYNRFMLDGYSETGAGALNLTVAQQTETSLQWLAKAGFEFGAGPGTLAASLGAGYDTLDAAQTTASFSGGGPLFVANGIKPDSTVLTGGLGYRYVTEKSLEINAGYDVESRGSDYLAQTLSVKFRLPF